MKRHLIILALMLTCLFSASGQDIRIPSILSFEDEEEWKEWKVNTGTSDAKDKWMRGNATSSDGEYSMYISNNGVTPQFDNTQNIVYAYRTLKFPETTGMGRYDISFDWKCATDTTMPQLYVYFGLEEALLPQSSSNPWGLDIASYASSNSAIMPKALSTACQKLLCEGKTLDFLSGSKRWRTATLSTDVKISSANSKRKYILLFIWVNDLLNDTLPSQGGVCIDNIQISSANVKRPENLSAYMNCEDSTLHVAWDSPLKFFEIQYKDVNDTHWRSRTHWPRNEMDPQTFSTKLRDEGFFDVRVRGATATTDPDTSAWTIINDIEFWCPENHCVDYIHLDREGVECRYGRLNVTTDTVGYWPAEDIDDSYGHHTVIKEQYTDPRTIYSYDHDGNLLTDFYGNPIGLQAIPENEKVSVRLGNWQRLFGHESITFEYEVDSVQNAILVLKYAIVLEQPEANGRSGFSIRVLDENGREIDPSCGKVEFAYSTEMTPDLEEHWYRSYFDPEKGENTYDPSKSNNDEMFHTLWKDWSSAGINLAPYHGRTVKVELHSWDCYGGGHYGYAYFTLDCVNAKLETTADACEMDATTIDVKAPEGFNYTWTDSHGRVVGTDRSFSAPPSHESYTCTACMLDGITGEPTSCCINLKTELSPRYAVPEYQYTYHSENCKSNVIFKNTSYVIQHSGGKDVKTGEDCDASWEFRHNYETDFTEYSDIEPWVECNPDGDTIYVRQRANLGNSECDSVMESVVYVPTIKTEPYIIPMEVCQGQDTFFYFYPQTQLIEGAGSYYDIRKNVSGCDSTTVLDLKVNPVSPPTYEVVNACSLDMPIIRNGRMYTAAGNFIENLQNIYKCDSTVYLDLRVTDKLRVNVDSLPVLCADGGALAFNFNILEGAFDSLTITFDSLAKEQGFYDKTYYDNSQTTLDYTYSSSIRPDVYMATLVFHQPQSCGNQEINLPVEISYPSSILAQKWNDVIAILSDDYNGGYHFTNYQWYKNGEPIEGANSPYLYLNGEEFSSVDYYYVRLTRDDGVTVNTCPIYPVKRTDQTQFPTIVNTLQRIRQNFEHTTKVTFYTLSGLVYSATTLTSGEQTIVMPAEQGVYIVTLQTGDETKRYKVLVVND